jgi:hypothetical protein
MIKGKVLIFDSPKEKWIKYSRETDSDCKTTEKEEINFRTGGIAQW